VNFTGNWKDREKLPLHKMVKDKIRPAGSLKPHLDRANKRMRLQIKKLDKVANQFTKRDTSLFAKTVKAYSKHDLVRARVYANELAEIRKSKKQIIDTKLALEQISLRLGTVSEFGDVVSVLSPTVSVLKNIGKGIVNTMPEAEKELGHLGNLLNGIIAESNQGTGMGITFEAPNDAAKTILNEAAKVAEENIKPHLPEMPVGVPAVKKKVLTKT